MYYSNSIKLAALALCLAGCGSETTSDSQLPAELQETEQQAETIYTVGDTVKAGDLEFTLKSIETKRSVGSPGWVDPAGPGETFVIARFSFKNLDTKPIGAIGLPDVDLIDGNGIEYGSDLEASSMASDGDSHPFDDINPGVAYNDTLAWKVVEESYDPAAWTVVVRTDPQLTFRLK